MEIQENAEKINLLNWLELFLMRNKEALTN